MRRKLRGVVVFHNKPQGEIPFAIDVKGGEKHRSQVEYESWSMSGVINAKRGDSWTIGFH
jgi:hypothetical protein